MKTDFYKQRGITLIALVVTIVVLLILAAVSINMLTGENGIIKQAQKAKEETVIGEEKEAIAIAVSGIMANKKGESGITAEELQNELINNTKRDIEVTGAGILEVEYKDTKHTYQVDGNGKIEQAETRPKVTDTTPGEFEGDGSESNPYQLMSIEDLVGLSQKVEDGETYGGKYFELNTDLDFESSKSYVDALRKDMGDVNRNGVEEELIVELTTGEGFRPIGYYRRFDSETEIDTHFDGIVNGHNHTIYNLYQKSR